MARDLKTHPAEAEIDLSALTWTCAEHGVTLPMASGAECPRCEGHWEPPPRPQSRSRRVYASALN